MTTREYEDELQSERRYIAGLYTRLDAERARVRAGYTAALRGPIDVKDGGTLVQRDSEVRALAKEVRRLDVADNGLCFGRLDALTGERVYIGRIGIFDSDDDYEPLL
ncbi:MAG: helicase, partial [Mycobacteriaceae bacterium]